MPVGPQLPGQQDEDQEEASSQAGKQSKQQPSTWAPTIFKMFESALTTLASVAILGVVGYSYTVYYKYMVLKKMVNAFKPGVILQFDFS